MENSTLWTPCSELPDAQTTVLIANLGWSTEPVWIGFYDGTQWVSAEGMTLISPSDSGRGDAAPTHWAPMPKFTLKDCR